MSESKLNRIKRIQQLLLTIKPDSKAFTRWSQAIRAMRDTGVRFRKTGVDIFGQNIYHMALVDSLESQPCEGYRLAAREYLKDILYDIGLDKEDVEWLMPNWHLDAITRLLQRMEIDEVSRGG